MAPAMLKFFQIYSMGHSFSHMNTPKTFSGVGGRVGGADPWVCGGKGRLVLLGTCRRIRTTEHFPHVLYEC